MRLRCQKDVLHRAVQAVLGVVASKGVHPVYESVLLSAGGDALTIEATDLEVGMKVVLETASDPPDAEADGGKGGKTRSGRFSLPENGIERGGSAVVPAQRLASILRELPTGEVVLDWDAEKREALIKAGRGTFRLQGPSPEDFPEIPDVGGAEEVAVRAADLRRMIQRTSFAAAKERMRFALNGLLLKVNGETLELVATDGRRLALCVGGCENPGGAKLRAIVPTKGLQQLDKNLQLEMSLNGPDSTVWLSIGNNHFRGRAGSVTVVSRLVEGSFPEYEDVIPKDCSRQVTMPRGELNSTLRRASLVTSRDAQAVRLEFGGEGEGLRVSAQSSEGSAEEELACAYDGDVEALGFNPEFLLDALSVLDGDDVRFEWNGPSTPGKITEGDYTYVVMPVTLD